MDETLARHPIFLPEFGPVGPGGLGRAAGIGIAVPPPDRDVRGMSRIYGVHPDLRGMLVLDADQS